MFEGRTDIQVRVNRTLFHGWKSISLTRTVDRLAGGFRISSSQLNPFEPQAQALVSGDRVEVLLNGQVALSGYVDKPHVSYDAEGHEVTYTGRDVTADLVDCSVDGPQSGPGEWLNADLLRIAQDVCAPYGIQVSTEADVGRPFGHVRAEVGATVLDHLAKLCRDRGLLAVSYGDGRLVLTRAGSRRATDVLVLGQNVKGGEAATDFSVRYSVYTVKGQAPSADYQGQTEYVSPSGQATDPAVKRYRPKTVLASTKSDPANCRDQAAWESTVRAGRSVTQVYPVIGWTMSDGRLWPLNALVRVRDAFAGIDRDMLITGLTFSLDNTAGQMTRISVAHPAAYTLAPQDKGAAGDVGLGWKAII